jgi:hypothetical protein
MIFWLPSGGVRCHLTDGRRIGPGGIAIPDRHFFLDHG